MSNFELQEKAVKAATRFIERKGYELLETGWTSPEGTRIDLIASDEDTLVFIDVTATEYGEGGFEGGKVKRGDLEIAAASWLAVNSPDGEMQVRFDIIDMLVVSADRVLLRHHINAFSCGAEQPTSIPTPAGGPGAPRGHPEGLFPCLPAVPHDSLCGRKDASGLVLEVLLGRCAHGGVVQIVVQELGERRAAEPLNGELLDGPCELVGAFGGDGDASRDVAVLAVIVHVNENELLVQHGVVFHGRATFLEAARCPNRFRTQSYAY